MRKKTIVILTLATVLLLAITGGAIAKDVTYTLKGVINTLGAGEMTVYNPVEGLVTVDISESEILGDLGVGYSVNMEGLWVEGGFKADKVSVTSMTLVGVITEIPEIPEGELVGTITIQIEGGALVTVQLPADYIATLAVGDAVRFTGTWDGDVFVADVSVEVCLEGTVSGEPTEDVDLGGYTITVITGGGTPVTVLLPGGFDLSSVADGDFVRACGMWVDADDPPDGAYDYFAASTVEVNPSDEEEEEEVEPGGRGGVYCDGLKENNHPLWDKIAGMYDGVDPEWVKDQFCMGFGYGEIMIALKLQSMLPEGVEVDARWILSERNEHGWGWIKKFFQAYTGPEEETLPGEADQQDESLPPGLAKKQDDESLPPGQAKKQNEEKVPGWAKKPDKGRGPNK